ncbi:plasmid pRiA4b ORF-3 family protein [Fuchsiella alkaliacetigena]|uniref:plasmid pRiA4b ORF-3 family protein n=1 Tax=Fuchsiella alkaliacetigena TaxID=957042 RepID=UPI00200AF39F|nr:plasmid pRiA4b ORF-3 family protein [Fuchsiella alkaliacetigena]MCK8825739.1 plasmid pRiA4b ORF-3 family protein [Fuchsiella alkaliacetigena]
MKLTISKEIPILKDFPVFINYLEENEIQLTVKNQNLRGPDLYEMNQMIYHTVPDTTKRSRQRIYPVLHLFYHLVLAGKLFKKESRGSKSLLVPTERLEEYQELTLTEKYMFLLETFWVDCDWDQLQEASMGDNPLGYFSLLVEDFLDFDDILAKQSAAKEVDLRVEIAGSELFYWGYFLLYFAYFGFWKVVFKKQNDDCKSTYIPETVEVSPFGVVMMNVLTHRNLDLWNLAQRRKLGDFKGQAGSPLQIEYEDDFRGDFFFMMDSEEPMADNDILEEDDDWEGEEFIEVFIPLFSEGELENTLPRVEEGFKSGSYIFKILLNRKNWCRVEFAAAHTLEDLHRVIREVFNLGGDHLYAFFMDGKAWSQNSISDPRDEGPDTCDFQIGYLGLEEGQEILYIFDYGTEIRFKVRLEDIDEEGEDLVEPVIIKQKVDL